MNTIKSILEIYNKPKLILKGEHSKEAWLTALKSDLSYLEDLPEEFKNNDFYNVLFENINFKDIKLELLPKEILSQEIYIDKLINILSYKRINLEDYIKNIDYNVVKKVIDTDSNSLLYHRFNIYKTEHEKINNYHLELINNTEFKGSEKYGYLSIIRNMFFEYFLNNFNEIKNKEEMLNNLVKAIYKCSDYMSKEDFIYDYVNNMFIRDSYKDLLDNNPELNQIFFEYVNKNIDSIYLLSPFLKITQVFEILNSHLLEFSQKENFYKMFDNLLNKRNKISYYYYNLEVIKNVLEINPFLIKPFLKKETLVKLIEDEDILIKYNSIFFSTKEKLNEQDLLLSLNIYKIIKNLSNSEYQLIEKVKYYIDILENKIEEFINFQFQLSFLDFTSDKDIKTLISKYLSKDKFIEELNLINKKIYNFSSIYKDYKCFFDEKLVLMLFYKNIIDIYDLKCIENEDIISTL